MTQYSGPSETQELVHKSPEPPKKKRRSKAEIGVIKDAMMALVKAEHPMSVRQVFYRLVSSGTIDKTEAAYKGTVVRLLGELRREGRMPYHWIADNTRWQRKPRSHSSMESALQITQQAYRRALWDDQDAYVEIWLEKEALSGVVFGVTGRWDVPLMVTRGYPSISYLHTCGSALQGIEKPVFIYYFGDYDPSGVDIRDKVEQGIREFAPDEDITFQGAAVTPAQIKSYKLPTRPTKKTDSRAKNFKGESVELDAIPPQDLRDLVEDCITQHIDRDLLERTRMVEREERRSLLQIVEQGMMGGLR
jgi:hypothetical protein